MECPECGDNWDGGEKCPRILHCGHVFCETCLRSWLKGGGSSIDCGVCGLSTSVTNGDVDYLIPVKHLVELQKSQKKQDAPEHAVDVDAGGFAGADVVSKSSFAPLPRAEISASNDCAPPRPDVVKGSTGMGIVSGDSALSGSADFVQHNEKYDPSAVTPAHVGESGVETTAVEGELGASNAAVQGNPSCTTVSAGAGELCSAPDTGMPNVCAGVPISTQVDSDKCFLDTPEQALPAESSPWGELIGHSAALVEHTVGAVVCVGQGLVEADRQFGISTAVVGAVGGAVDGIVRRVSGTIELDPPLAGDPQNSDPNAGSKACVIS